jgi:hypothetical protein
MGVELYAIAKKPKTFTRVKIPNTLAQNLSLGIFFHFKCLF